MSQTATLNTFPSNKIAALTMLYLENQDLSTLTPQELAAKYTDVYAQISDSFKEERKVKSSGSRFF